MTVKRSKQAVYEDRIEADGVADMWRAGMEAGRRPKSWLAVNVVELQGLFWVVVDFDPDVKPEPRFSRPNKF